MTLCYNYVKTKPMAGSDYVRFILNELRGVQREWRFWSFAIPIVLWQLRQNPELLPFASRVEQCAHRLSSSLIPAQHAIESRAKRFNEIPRSFAAEANARFSAELRHFTKITRSFCIPPEV